MMNDIKNLDEVKEAIIIDGWEVDSKTGDYYLVSSGTRYKTTKKFYDDRLASLEKQYKEGTMICQYCDKHPPLNYKTCPSCGHDHGSDESELTITKELE